MEGGREEYSDSNMPVEACLVSSCEMAVGRYLQGTGSSTILFAARRRIKRSTSNGLACLPADSVASGTGVVAPSRAAKIPRS